MLRTVSIGGVRVFVPYSQTERVLIASGLREWIKKIKAEHTSEKAATNCPSGEN